MMLPSVTRGMRGRTWSRIFGLSFDAQPPAFTCPVSFDVECADTCFQCTVGGSRNGRCHPRITVVHGAYAAAISLTLFLLPGGLPRRLTVAIQAGGRPRRLDLP